MPPPASNDAPPRTILLATDLDARGDRALDRAALLASTWQSDLVVLGSRGRSALTNLFLGSAARQILEHLPCDALVVRAANAAVEADSVIAGTTGT